MKLKNAVIITNKKLKKLKRVKVELKQARGNISELIERIDNDSDTIHELMSEINGLKAIMAISTEE